MKKLKEFIENIPSGHIGEYFANELTGFVWGALESTFKEYSQGSPAKYPQGIPLGILVSTFEKYPVGSFQKYSVGILWVFLERTHWVRSEGIGEHFSKVPKRFVPKILTGYCDEYF